MTETTEMEDVLQKEKRREKTRKLTDRAGKGAQLSQVDKVLKFYRSLTSILIGSLVVMFLIALVFLFVVTNEYSQKIYVISPEGMYVANGKKYETPDKFILRQHIKIWVDRMFAFDGSTYNKNIEEALNLCDRETGKIMVKAYETRQYKTSLQTYDAIVKASIDTMVMTNSTDPFTFRARVIQTVATADKRELNVYWTIEFDVVQVGRNELNPLGLMITDFKILSVDSDDGDNEKNKKLEKKDKGEYVAPDDEQIEEETPELDKEGNLVKKKKKTEKK